MTDEIEGYDNPECEAVVQRMLSAFFDEDGNATRTHHDTMLILSELSFAILCGMLISGLSKDNAAIGVEVMADTLIGSILDDDLDVTAYVMQ